MTRQEKKNGELHWLTTYINLSGLTVAPDEIVLSEQPDFCVTIDGAVVGVEVTEYHMEGNRRQAEEVWIRLQKWPMLLNDYPKQGDQKRFTQFSWNIYKSLLRL